MQVNTRAAGALCLEQLQEHKPWLLNVYAKSWSVQVRCTPVRGVIAGRQLRDVPQGLPAMLLPVVSLP